MFFSLNNLLDVWSEKLNTEAGQIKLVEDAYESIYKSHRQRIALVDLKKKELVIEVDNHSLMMNMQLAKEEVVASVNKELSKNTEFRIQKIRFRLGAFGR